MICKTGDIIIGSSVYTSDLIAFVIINNLCVINNRVFRFTFYNVMYEFQRTRVEFKLLTDQNFIWDRMVKKVL